MTNTDLTKEAWENPVTVTMVFEKVCGFIFFRNELALRVVLP